MTADEFDALAQLLRQDARHAAVRLVLVDGLRQTDVAVLLGMHRQNLNRIVNTYTSNK